MNSHKKIWILRVISYDTEQSSELGKKDLAVNALKQMTRHLRSKINLRFNCLCSLKSYEVDARICQLRLNQLFLTLQNVLVMKVCCTSLFSFSMIHKTICRQSNFLVYDITMLISTFVAKLWSISWNPNHCFIKNIVFVKKDKVTSNWMRHTKKVFFLMGWNRIKHIPRYITVNCFQFIK